MPSSWQWQGAGQAAGPAPGWGAPPAHGEAHSAAQSHSARSPGGLRISAAGCAAPGGRAAAARLRVPRPGRPAAPSVGTKPQALLGGGGGRSAGPVQSERGRHCGVILSLSCAGWAREGGTGGGGVREPLRCRSLPFPPSFRAGTNSIQERKKSGGGPKESAYSQHVRDLHLLRNDVPRTRLLHWGPACLQGQRRDHSGLGGGPLETTLRIPIAPQPLYHIFHRRKLRSKREAICLGSLPTDGGQPQNWVGSVTLSSGGLRRLS